MPTFQKKPETVDARQFTGGKENGMEIVTWINSVGGLSVTIMWDVLYGGTEIIKIIQPNYLETAFVGDWIMQRQNGYIEVVRPQMLELEYDQV